MKQSLTSYKRLQDLGLPAYRSCYAWHCTGLKNSGAMKEWGANKRQHKTTQISVFYVSCVFWLYVLLRFLLDSSFWATNSKTLANTESLRIRTQVNNFCLEEAKLSPWIEFDSMAPQKQEVTCQCSTSSPGCFVLSCLEIVMSFCQANVPVMKC